MPERVTHLRAPVVVGQWYLVPTVFYGYAEEDAARPWPVFLPKHSDADRFPFKHAHFHVDPRFLDARTWARLKYLGVYYDADLPGEDEDAFGYAQRTPLARLKPEFTKLLNGDIGPQHLEPIPPVVWRRRRCARAAIPYQFGHAGPIVGLRSDFAGTQCREARGGWVCPHQRFPLGSVVPDADGFLTCPLHGLRIFAASGRVEGRPAPPPAPPKAPPPPEPEQLGLALPQDARP
jgi:hypothetical protein